MDSLTTSVASGMRSRLEALDMLANNLANATTAGFKMDRESYNIYVAPEAASADSPDPSNLPVVERHWTDFKQGQLMPTGNPLDLALQGSGFFAVNGPGGTLYTRNGSLQMATDGTLTTGEGYAVRDTEGRPIQLQPEQPFDVSVNGTINQGGKAVAQIAVVNFEQPEALSKTGNTYFQATEGSGKVSLVQTAVHQGVLESSNGGTPETAVRLVSILRQFEMLHKAMSLGQDMSQRAINEVAKV